MGTLCSNKCTLSLHVMIYSICYITVLNNKHFGIKFRCKRTIYSSTFQRQQWFTWCSWLLRTGWTAPSPLVCISQKDLSVLWEQVWPTPKSSAFTADTALLACCHLQSLWAWPNRLQDSMLLSLCFVTDWIICFLFQYCQCWKYWS